MQKKKTHPLVKTLPVSKPVYPDRPAHILKYYLWVAYSPWHQHVRDSLLSLGVVKARGRQPFLLGTISPSVSLEDFVAHLVREGYAYHRVAWEDEGEVVGLRLVQDFVYQYHIRIFEDGEVRGHYEYTPECHPVRHLWDVGQVDRRDYFLKLLGERLLPSTSADPEAFQWEFLSLRQRPSDQTSH